ncbi:MAG: glycosyltransferase family 2 protein [Polyangiales bacterium]
MTVIVFPMAGASRRFREAGYTAPKYMLEARGRSLFAHAVEGFAGLAGRARFLFVATNAPGTESFVRRECAALGLAAPAVVLLDAPTRGQADTVALGLDRADVADDEPVTVFNIDTFRPRFRYPTAFDPAAVDGYLEVFRGEGPNWSYVRPAAPGSHRVAETTEKVPVSDLCCTGLYHFRAAGLFRAAFGPFAAGAAAAMGLRELYVAPMYNLLLRDGRDVRWHLIERDEVTFCGVPEEYDAFRGAP